MQKPLQILLLLLVSLVNSSCSNITLKDVTLYWPMGPDGAAVSHTISDETSKISKEQWDIISATSVAMSYDDFGWFRATIEKLCSDHDGLCKKEKVDEKIASFGNLTRAAAKRARRKERNENP